MKVTVCIPTYNYGCYIAESIESILNQSFTDFELLIVDDHSSDDTAAVVATYAEKDSRIRFSINPDNIGMVNNWNFCLSQAHGEYIKFVFGDDLLASTDALEQMVALLDSDTTISLVASSRFIIDEASVVMSIESGFHTDYILPGYDVINYLLFRQKNLIGEPSVTMFRKSQATRGFDCRYEQIVDLEMWFHLLKQGRFAYINHPLCSFRTHEKQQTAKNKESLNDADDVLCLIEDYFDKPYINLSAIMKFYLLYDHLYGVWKHSQNKGSKKLYAEKMIATHCGLISFWLLYPFYKFYKPFLKIYRKVRKPL